MTALRGLALLLAFIGGWADVGSFVGMDKLMAAHITGNIVLLAADLARGFGVSEIIRLAAVPVFFVAVVLLTIVHDDHILPGHSSQVRIPRLLLIEACLLILAGCLSLVVGKGDETLGLGAAGTIALPAVLAMACQNAAHRLYPEIGPATTVMTGNITQFFIDQTRRVRGSSGSWEGEEPAQGTPDLPLLIAAFVLGCVVSAFVTRAIGPSSFLVPGALLVLAVYVQSLQPPTD
jgi:uncharacterized membrane protein YoaK (UPF0700 family)